MENSFEPQYARLSTPNQSLCLFSFIYFLMNTFQFDSDPPQHLTDGKSIRLREFFPILKSLPFFTPSSRRTLYMALIYHTSADEIRHEKLRLGGEKKRERKKKRKSKRKKGKASFSICSQTKRKSSGIEGFHLLEPPLARPEGVGTFSFVCNVRRIVKARLLLTSAASFFST
ncbi:hypothetical protein NPIL_667301 [Nephila pilipes]|uniref:Uncharacterized protein n=1 Tax=Nephila pilipes TaxID=299642 RepID=A0A8X6TP42_NEPPI|nr:hypothetical protein NPIL_667301 [Nephila pilipes]